MCSIEEIITAMVSTGCNPEQISAVVKVISAKTKRQERNARYYQSRVERLNKTVSDDIKTNSDALRRFKTVEDLHTLPLSPSLDKENIPKPLKEINPTHTPPHAKQGARVYTRGERLSKDWTLPDEWAKWATSEGHNEKTIRLEAEKFRDFFISKTGPNATKLDWFATFRNWMRSAKKPIASNDHASPKPISAFQQRQNNLQHYLDIELGRKPNDEFTGHTVDLGTTDFFSFRQA